MGYEKFVRIYLHECVGGKSASSLGIKATGLLSGFISNYNKQNFPNR